MPDLALAYQQARTSMTNLVRPLDEVALKRPIPACPDWSVKDLVGHVTSIASSLVAGKMPDDLRNLVMLWDTDVAAARESWIDEQIELRRDQSADEILDDWTAAGESVEQMLRGEKPLPPNAPNLFEWVLVTDIGVHHHDLRGALDAPGERDSLATGLSLRSYVEGMRLMTAHKGLPPMRINAGARSWTTAEGEPLATVTADPFELARAASGRRAPEQVRAYAWEGDPEPFIQLFYPYGMRADALVE